MAVSNITTNLTKFNPVYNPVVFGFDSTNKNQPGFRYVVDVYLAGTATKIFEARVAPRPNDGYGYIDLSKILANYLSYDIDLTNTTSSAVTNSYLKFDVKIGEEYQVNWVFTDSVFDTGKTKLLGTTTPTFVAGDQIVVNLTNPSYFPTLVGLHTVDSIVGNNVILNLAFVSSPTNPGTATYADGRKTITRGLLVYSDYVVWNGALSPKEWPSYNSANYTINTAPSSSRLLLTNIPDNFYAKTTQDIWINWAPYLSATPYYVYFTNSNGDVFRKQVNNTTQELRQFSAGPNNVGALSLVSGTAGLIKSDTTYYDFYVTNISGTAMCKKYRINIDRRCNIEDYEIVFQDRLGSFVSYSFSLRSKLSGQISRETYNKQIGDITGGKWTYNLSDAGMVNTGISVTEEYELNTDWMTYEMNEYFVELLTSPITFVKIDNVYYRCVVTDTNYEIQSNKLRKLIKRSIKIKLSLEPIVNI